MIISMEFKKIIQAVSIVALISATTAKITIAADFERIGYFKGPNVRIMTYQFAGLQALDNIKDLIESGPGYLTGGPGSLTAVYFYPVGSVVPGIELTTSRNAEIASNVVYHPQKYGIWEFSYLNGFSGKATFSDCLTSPKNGVCK